jgi:hypothetical protein
MKDTFLVGHSGCVLLIRKGTELGEQTPFFRILASIEVSFMKHDISHFMRMRYIQC